MKTGKRALVTGRAGFFSCHLCDRFIAQLNEVLYIDNFLTVLLILLLNALGDPAHD